MAEAALELRKSRAPFRMPDGQSLTAFLDNQQLRLPRGDSHGGTSSRQHPRPRAIKEGWTKALPRAAAAAAAAPPSASGGAYSDAEQAELYALSRVGQRKQVQNRWANDKLLRNMAGTLSAADMASLFSPVPWGEERSSVWERAAQPEHAMLWDLFRSLDMDKQKRVLQKWEAHVRELQAGPAAMRNPAIDALAAWAGVSWKARQAMKRAGPSFVQAVEAQVLAFLEENGVGVGEELVMEGLGDGFHRLIAHGLAEYHSLPSHSRALEGGGKAVVVRRRQGAAAAPPPAAAHRGGHQVAHHTAVGADLDEEAAAAAPAAHQGLSVLAIACSDILQLLVDDPNQPLSAAVLRQAYLQPDSSSKVGDH